MTDDYYSKVFAEAEQAEKGKAGPGRPHKRKRRVYGYRIDDEDAARIKTLAADLGTSHDALMRALVPAALDAVERGWLELDSTTEYQEGRDSKGRVRAWAVRLVRWSWTLERNE